MRFFSFCFFFGRENYIFIYEGGEMNMRKFLGIFVKAYGTMLLVASCISNLLLIGGAVGIVAILLNITLIFSIWFPIDRES